MKKKMVKAQPAKKPDIDGVCFFVTQYYGVQCWVNVFRENGQYKIRARRAPTEQNKRTKWHNIDIGEMLARTSLELVR